MCPHTYGSQKLGIRCECLTINFFLLSSRKNWVRHLLFIFLCNFQGSLTHLSTINLCANLRSGGDKEIRTLDPLLARQVLSQLSYTPKYLVLKKPFYTVGLTVSPYISIVIHAGECIKFICSLRRINLAFFAADLPAIFQNHIRGHSSSPQGLSLI